jgi:hypothetical protein
MADIDRVLAPDLYRQLQQFGEIKISNEGQPMVFGPTTCVNQRWQQSVLFWGETYRVICPFCTDRSYRLYVPYTYGQPDPNNNYWPSTYFGRCFNETDCLTNSSKRRELADRILGFRNRNERYFWRLKPASETPEYIRHPIPPGQCVKLTKLPHVHPAVQYLAVTRRVPYELFDYYGLSFCLEPDSRWEPEFARMLYGRIIIPVWFNGAYAGWQARYVGEPPKHVPKYVTMKGMAKSRILYNLDRARLQSYGVVSEGVSDVWAIGDAGMAAFGQPMRWEQHELLAQHFHGKPIVLLYDPDAVESTAKDEKLLRDSGHFPHVLVVRLPPGLDPGKCGSYMVNNLIFATAAQAGVRLV